jgi:hypothetical protein
MGKCENAQVTEDTIQKLCHGVVIFVSGTNEAHC